jgi:hypothetical protein
VQVPGSAQNFLEWVVESVYGLLESIIGRHLVEKTFWFFGTIFIFILAANWIGLIPGVGTIGWGHQTSHGFVIEQPLFRGANADLNMTLAMALVFFACWIVWAFQEVGVVVPSGLVPQTGTFPGASVEASDEKVTKRPSSLIEAIAYLESWGDPKAESPAGPRGIMQVSAATAATMGLKVTYATRYRTTREKVAVKGKRGAKTTYRVVTRKTPYRVLLRDKRLMPERAIPAATRYLAGMGLPGKLVLSLRDFLWETAVRQMFRA